MALRKCQELKCEMIVIDVREPTKGYRLWKRLGFKEYGRLPDYARVKDTKITGIYMYAYVADTLRHFETTGSWFIREQDREPV
jgi:hypothetical protein